QNPGSTAESRVARVVNQHGMEAATPLDLWSDFDHDCPKDDWGPVRRATWRDHDHAIAAVDGSDLPQAIRDALDTLDRESREEGFELVTKCAKDNAERLLGVMIRHFSRQHFEVYPTRDREVAVDAAGAVGSCVLVLFDSDGGATCFATIKG